jgi:hypothetical protein
MNDKVTRRYASCTWTSRENDVAGVLILASQSGNYKDLRHVVDGKFKITTNKHP